MASVVVVYKRVENARSVFQEHHLVMKCRVKCHTENFHVADNTAVIAGVIVVIGVLIIALSAVAIVTCVLLFQCRKKRYICI